MVLEQVRVSLNPAHPPELPSSSCRCGPLQPPLRPSSAAITSSSRHRGLVLNPSSWPRPQVAVAARPQVAVPVFSCFLNVKPFHDISMLLGAQFIFKSNNYIPPTVYLP
jgi:hypothetical protein